MDEGVEQRIGIEARHTHPPDRSVTTDKAGRRAVPDQPMIFDWQITIEVAERL
jgi:hypothetical protein